jgi:hypothetical protein
MDTLSLPCPEATWTKSRDEPFASGLKRGISSLVFDPRPMQQVFYSGLCMGDMDHVAASNLNRGFER